MEFGKTALAYESSHAGYQDHVLEQYKIYSQRLEADLTRHESTNQFFLTINTAVVSALFIANQSDFDIAVWGVVFITLPALLICLLWHLTLRSVSRSLTAQHKTLQSMEVFLPLKPFTSEWHNQLQGGSGYWKIRSIKQWVPWVFVLVHLGLLGYILIGSGA